MKELLIKLLPFYRIKHSSAVGYYLVQVTPDNLVEAPKKHNKIAVANNYKEHMDVPGMFLTKFYANFVMSKYERAENKRIAAAMEAFDIKD